MQNGTTVRIDPITHRRLKALAEQSGESLTAVLDKAVELYRRQRILEESNRAFAALRGDAPAWQQELAERKAWDSTLGDGLEDGLVTSPTLGAVEDRVRILLGL